MVSYRNFHVKNFSKILNYRGQYSNVTLTESPTDRQTDGRLTVAQQRSAEHRAVEVSADIP